MSSGLLESGGLEAFFPLLPTQVHSLLCSKRWLQIGQSAGSFIRGWWLIKWGFRRSWVGGSRNGRPRDARFVAGVGPSPMPSDAEGGGGQLGPGGKGQWPRCIAPGAAQQWPQCTALVPPSRLFSIFLPFLSFLPHCFLSF